MDLNAIWSFIIGIICYISFVVSYAYMFIDLYLICGLSNKEYDILTKYYGMLRF